MSRMLAVVLLAALLCAMEAGLNWFTGEDSRAMPLSEIFMLLAISGAGLVSIYVLVEKRT